MKQLKEIVRGVFEDEYFQEQLDDVIGDMTEYGEVLATAITERLPINTEALLTDIVETDDDILYTFSVFFTGEDWLRKVDSPILIVVSQYEEYIEVTANDEAINKFLVPKSFIIKDGVTLEDIKNYLRKVYDKN